MKGIRKRIARGFTLAGVGDSIPFLLVTSWCIVYALNTFDMGGIRMLFYVLLLYSSFLGTRAINRAVRGRYAATGEDPSIYHIAVFWHMVSLIAMSSGLLMVALNLFVPAIPDVPESFLIAQVSSSTLALSITSYILDYGGRTGRLAMSADPGILRVFKSWRR